MPGLKPDGGPRAENLTPADITRLFGDIDAETVFAILALQPTVAELEEAALHAAGNGEAVGGRQATSVVAEILDLIDTGDEEDKPRVAGPGRP